MTNAEIESVAKFAMLKSRQFAQQAFGDSRVEDAANVLEDIALMLRAEFASDRAVKEPDLANALARIALGDDACQCDHGDENCCEVVGEFCPRCIAETVLRKVGLCADVDVANEGERGAAASGRERTAPAQGDVHSLRTPVRSQEQATLHGASPDRAPEGSAALRRETSNEAIVAAEGLIASPASQSVKQASQHVAELVLKLGDTKRGEELLAAINALRDADREVSPPATPSHSIGSLLHLEGNAIERQESLSSPARPRTRYFVNVKGFGDGTQYVRADADGRCFGIQADGQEWLYKAGSLAGFVEKVERGIWREMTEIEAASPARPQLKTRDKDAQRITSELLDLLLDSISGPLVDESAEHFDIIGLILRRPDIERFISGHITVALETFAEGAVSAAPPALEQIEREGPTLYRPVAKGSVYSMTPDAMGEWVHISDYDRLADLARLRAPREEQK